MPDSIGGGDDLQDGAATAELTGLAAPRAARRARWPLFLGLVVAIAVLDQLAKAWIVATIPPGRSVALLGDLVRLVHSQNTGGLFGLFRDNASLFALASLAVIGAIAWYHGRAAAGLLLSVALGLLAGGAVGNLVDRLVRGYVVDFVDAGIGGLRWYTFNVADAAISTSLVLLVLITLRPSLVGEGGAAPRPAGGVRDPAADA